jgi:septal ring factor EnvC (AmiA/AmiB activator)
MSLLTLKVAFEPLHIHIHTDDAEQTRTIKRLRRRIMALEEQVERTEAEAAELEQQNIQLAATIEEKNAAIAERDAIIEELQNSQAPAELLERLTAANDRLDAANAEQANILSQMPPVEGGGGEGG